MQLVTARKTQEEWHRRAGRPVLLLQGDWSSRRRLSSQEGQEDCRPQKLACPHLRARPESVALCQRLTSPRSLRDAGAMICGSLSRPWERDMHRLSPQCSAADTAERWRLAQWLVCQKNTWPSGPMRDYRGPGVPPTHVLDGWQSLSVTLPPRPQLFHPQKRRSVAILDSCVLFLFFFLPSRAPDGVWALVHRLDCWYLHHCLIYHLNDNNHGITV